MDGVEQAHSTRPGWKNTGNFIGPKLGTVAEITLQRTDTTHDLSSESREAIKSGATPTAASPHITCASSYTPIRRAHTRAARHQATRLTTPQLTFCANQVLSTPTHTLPTELLASQYLAASPSPTTHYCIRRHIHFTLVPAASWPRRSRIDLLRRGNFDCWL